MFLPRNIPRISTVCFSDCPFRYHARKTRRFDLTSAVAKALTEQPSEPLAPPFVPLPVRRYREAGNRALQVHRKAVRTLGTFMIALLAAASLGPSLARGQEPAELKKELQAIKEEYAIRIATLEERIAALENRSRQQTRTLPRREP
jgi:hypothetical protein